MNGSLFSTSAFMFLCIFFFLLCCMRTIRIVEICVYKKNYKYMYVCDDEEEELGTNTYCNCNPNSPVLNIILSMNPV